MPTYQWYLNEGIVHGATNAVFTYDQYQDQDSVTCRVVNHTPCGDFATTNTVHINVSNVGVANVSGAFDVRLVPNPSKGDFIIKGNVSGIGSEDVMIEITDMLGQVVHTGKADVRNGSIDEHIQLDRSLANGIYIVNLRSSSVTKAVHLVLQQ